MIQDGAGGGGGGARCFNEGIKVIKGRPPPLVCSVWAFKAMNLTNRISSPEGLG